MLNRDRRSTIESAYDAAAQRAGWLLLATAAATAVAVFGRLAAGADLPALAESLAAVGRRRGWYGIGGAARLLSGITLFAGAWFLWHTRLMHRRLGTLLASVFLAASGLFTAVSGAVCRGTGAGGAGTRRPRRPLHATAAPPPWWRSCAGSAARSGSRWPVWPLLATALRQWRVGGRLRRLAPASALVGAAMPFIWVDAVTLLHRLSGPLFMVWLALIGFMLASGRVQRRMAGAAARRTRLARARRTG